MITIQEINSLIDFNMDSIKKLNQELKERVITKNKHKLRLNKHSENISFLRKIKEYIELVNLNQQQIKKEISRIEKLIDSIMNGYDNWFATSSCEYPPAKRNLITYRNINEVSKLENQIKNLKFILN